LSTGWSNACADDGKVFLGQPIAQWRDHEAIKGVVVYELAHWKCSHQLKFAVILSLAGTPAMMFTSNPHLPWVAGVVVLFAWFALVVSSTSWYFEYEADRIAAEYVGAARVRQMLESFVRENPQHLHRDTWLHPALARRIDKLQSIGN